jgi:hypothetical protein
VRPEAACRTGDYHIADADEQQQVGEAARQSVVQSRVVLERLQLRTADIRRAVEESQRHIALSLQSLHALGRRFQRLVEVPVAPADHDRTAAANAAFVRTR